MVVWVITLLLLSILVYLNLIGLPDFVKHPLLAKLNERGLNLKFTTLRLHWTRGFIAENVAFASSTEEEHPELPRLTAREMEFNLRLRSLIRGRLQVDGLILRDGKLAWTLTETNAPNRTLTIERIESSLRLLPNDEWLLEDLRGQFGGAKFYLSGSLANASALSDWQAQPSRRLDLEEAREQLREIMDVMEQISFQTPPEVHLDITGDARDLASFTVRFTVGAKDADTAWGKAHDVLLTANMLPVGTNALSRVEISLQALELETPWASTTNLDIDVRLESTARQPGLVNATATVRAGLVIAPDVMLTGMHAKASWTHAVTNPVPREGQLEVHADTLTSWMTRARDCDFSATWSTVTNPLPAAATLGFWTNLLPYQVQCAARIAMLRSLALQADNLRCEAEWAAPRLSFSKFETAFYRGPLTGTGELDVVSRVATVSAESHIDPKRFAPLLPRPVQEWLDHVTWSAAPELRGTATIALPEWTAPREVWETHSPTNVHLAGYLAVTNGTFRGIHSEVISTHFSFSNYVWQTPDLTITRPEGSFRAAARMNEATGDFYAQLHSTIDPAAIVPLLGAEVRRGFDLCEFGQPPVVEGEIWGRGADVEALGFQGHVALTNFVFRGEAVDAAISGVRYTNLTVDFIEPRAWHGTQHVSAVGVAADFNAHRVYITNASGMYAPSSIVHMIGPMVAEVMSHYHFGKPPMARAHGYVSMRDPHDANIVFEGGGEDFESLRFRIPRYTARIIWQNNLLSVTNLTGDFYGGRAQGWAHFVFGEDDNAQLQFAVYITNASLPALVADLTQRTNNLDGRLSGNLIITNGMTDDFDTWSGYGYASLRDGLLWELPIFGKLSDVLEVGNTRFTEAVGNYTVAQRTLYSPDLELRAASMRLLYRGTVTFDGDISARVTAELLGNTPVFGPMIATILSPVAKALAFRVSGTVQDPKYEPINIPKFLLAPFSPLQTLEQILSPEPLKPPAPPEIK